MLKIKKYQFITCLIAIYALFMTFYFGLDLLKEGHSFRFWTTLIFEGIVIVLAYFALKKRDSLKEKRNQNQI